MITKNYIIDITYASKDSQASLFSDDLKKCLKDCENESTEIITPKSIDIIKTFEEKSKFLSVKLTKDFLKSLYIPNNSNQRHSFNIYRQIIEMHLYKQYVFKPQTVALYSEQDFIVKFWAYTFEEVFSNSGLCLHWGDTQPKKIDLRILCSMSTKQSDLSVGEFARKAITSKLYNDKSKEVLISKLHLNNVLLSGLSQATTDISLIQIMGLNCQQYALRYVEGFYLLENVYWISFPTTYQNIKDNGIAKLITYLETSKDLYLDLKKAIKTNSLKMTASKMANIPSIKDKEKNKLDIRSMVWPSDSEDDEDEEDEEENAEIIQI